MIINNVEWKKNYRNVRKLLTGKLEKATTKYINSVKGGVMECQRT